MDLDMRRTLIVAALMYAGSANDARAQGGAQRDSTGTETVTGIGRIARGRESITARNMRKPRKTALSTPKAVRESPASRPESDGAHSLSSGRRSHRQ